MPIDYNTKFQNNGLFNLNAIDDHFPMDEYRDGQKDAIIFALNAFNEGKKVVILECPTGSGKSPIGMTVADMVDTSYYLTVTKILQDQLMNDFGDQIIELKGRGSYPCTYWQRFGQKMVHRKLISEQDLATYELNNGDCSVGFCRTKLNAGENKFRCGKCFTKDNKGELDMLSVNKLYSDCPYYEQVFAAINSRKVVMNFSSFLFQTQMTKRFNEPRDLVVIDECHNLEPQLLDFVSMRLTDFNLQDFGIIIPKYETAQEYAVWFEDQKIHEHLIKIIKEAEDNENHRLVDDTTRILVKYKMFMEQIVSNEGSDWVIEYEEKTANKKQYRVIILKPVFADSFVQPLIFRYAKRVLMMSATVLDVGVVAKSLGIDRNHIAAYRMKNRFPVKNRPIYLETVGKMTGGKHKMHEWAPAMVKKIDEILLRYPNDRGIIHTHNFTIMDFILKHGSSATQKRLMNQNDFSDKNELLKEHAKTFGAVIIAPAMHEGVDLKDDLSRFQIICKVPFANCFDDKQLARRVEVDRKYYTWITALKLIQSYGRSIRSENDYADTYILDGSIHKFLLDAKQMIPAWFTEAISRRI